MPKPQLWPKAIFTHILTAYLRNGAVHAAILDKALRPFDFQHQEPRTLVDDAIRSRVHAYLATTIRELESPWVVVGGVVDHVPILFDMGKMMAPVKFVEQAKRESSKFVKTLGSQYAKFYWQRGYGMFSVSPKDRDEAERYLRNQEEHHRQHTFQDNIGRS